MHDQSWLNRVYRWLVKSDIALSCTDIAKLVIQPETNRVVLPDVFLNDVRFALDSKGLVRALPYSEWRFNGHLNETEFVVTDLETTGSVLGEEEIFEIGAVKMVGKEQVGQFHSYVRAAKPVAPFVVRMTRLDQRVLKDAPTIDEILPDFFRFAGSAIFVAHNSEFDFNFMYYEAQKHFVKSCQTFDLCTVLLAHNLIPEAEKYGLDELSAYHKGDLKNRHSAIADAEMTANLLAVLIDRMPAKENTIFDMLNWEKKSFQKILRPLKRLKKLA